MLNIIRSQYVPQGFYQTGCYCAYFQTVSVPKTLSVSQRFSWDVAIMLFFNDSINTLLVWLNINSQLNTVSLLHCTCIYDDRELVSMTNSFTLLQLVCSEGQVWLENLRHNVMREYVILYEESFRWNSYCTRQLNMPDVDIAKKWKLLGQMLTHFDLFEHF